MIPKTRLLVAAMLAAAVAAPVAPAHAAAQQITMVGTQFTPTVTVVGPGESVAWTNQEPADYPVVLGKHNVVPDQDLAGLPGNKPFPLSGPLLKQNESWTCEPSASGIRCPVPGETRYVAIPPGTYAFRCGIHPNQMRGLLIVQ